MKKTRVLSKTVILTVVIASSLYLAQITYAVESSIREGHDFTVITAGADYKAGELLVRFARNENGQHRNLAEKRQILNSLGGATIKHNFKLPGLNLVKLPAGQTVRDALKTFNGTNGILYAEPDYKIYLTSTEPNDPDYEAGNLWGLLKIDANDAWDIHTGSSDIIVAVIDTGVDYDHNDLADNMWTDANGFYGYDFADGDADPNDYVGHGTHVAGTIGAVGNNNEGVVGVCWNVRIMAVKIFSAGDNPKARLMFANSKY